MKKDIEWLKKSISDIIEYYYEYPLINGHTQGMINEIKKVMEQADEPEVLSQEWLDAHTYHEDEYDFYYMDPDEVKEVLVPKQEEVDRAYKDGYEKGKQHTFYKGYLEGLTEGERKTNEYFESITEEPSYEQVQKYLSEHGIEVVEKEPETVADVIADFFKSLERLKEVMSMEVEELEE